MAGFHFTPADIEPYLHIVTVFRQSKFSNNEAVRGCLTALRSCLMGQDRVILPSIALESSNSHSDASEIGCFENKPPIRNPFQCDKEESFPQPSSRRILHNEWPLDSHKHPKFPTAEFANRIECGLLGKFVSWPHIPFSSAAIRMMSASICSAFRI